MFIELQKEQKSNFIALYNIGRKFFIHKTLIG
jgi:hypothetical protein